MSIEAAFYGVAAAMFVSSGIVLGWMRETHPVFVGERDEQSGSKTNECPE